jgi:ABC-type phosphate transport system substrate-binding protein
MAATVGAAGLVASLVGVGAAWASGLQPPATGIKKTTLEISGSNTTMYAMRDLAAAYQADTVSNPDKVKMNNVLAVLAPGVSVNVKAQPSGEGSTCGAYTWGPDATNPPPNGSSAGITAYTTNIYPATVAGSNTSQANDQNGCIGLSRSSRGRTGSDPAFIHFWAYAKDAIDAVRFKTSTVAATDLTQGQIQGIYLCSPITGMPTITDWHQVNPAAPVGSWIIRYLPQLGSGSISFFDTQILGVAAPTATVDHAEDNCTNPNGAGQIFSKYIEENEAVEICQGAATVPVPATVTYHPATCAMSGGVVTEDDRNVAISTYGFGQYTAMKNGVVTPNLTDGTKMDKIGGVKPTGGTGGTINAGTFLGWRYIYNVLSDRLPATLESQAQRFATNGPAGPGYICTGGTTVTNLLVAEGMVPLTFGPDPNNPTFANSACKLEPNPTTP